MKNKFWVINLMIRSGFEGDKREVFFELNIGVKSMNTVERNWYERVGSLGKGWGAEGGRWLSVSVSVSPSLCPRFMDPLWSEPGTRVHHRTSSTTAVDCITLQYTGTCPRGASRTRDAWFIYRLLRNQFVILTRIKDRTRWGVARGGRWFPKWCAVYW